MTGMTKNAVLARAGIIHPLVADHLGDRVVQPPRNRAENEVMLYGPIVDDASRVEIEDYYGTANSPLAFAEAMDAVEGDRITLRIDSPGGLIHSGSSMLQRMREESRPIDVIVDGIAASAASWMAIAGDGPPAMAEMSEIMMHRAHGIAIGNARNMRSLAKMLEANDEQIADLYEREMDLDALGFDSGIALMDGEDGMGTFITAKQAIDAGAAIPAPTINAPDAEPEDEPDAMSAEVIAGAAMARLNLYRHKEIRDD